MLAPFIACDACDASWDEPMVTKAKPRDCPVSRSVTSLTSTTSPNSWKAVRTVSLVV